MTVRVYLCDISRAYDPAPTAGGITYEQGQRYLATIERIMDEGFDVQDNVAAMDSHIRFWIDFATEEEAVLFKLTHL